MSVLLIAALLAAPSPASAGPDAAAIADLDFRAGMSLCQDFHHVVPCPDRRIIVTDVGCKADPADRARASCTFIQRMPNLAGTQTCSGAFEWSGDSWHYPQRGGVERTAGGFPSLSTIEPTCSATGAPDAAAIAAVRAAVHPQLSCILYADAKRPCPAASARVGEVICDWGSAPRLAHCAYRVHAPEEYYCRAMFERRGRGWTMTAYRGSIGRLSYEENCNGPLSRP